MERSIEIRILAEGIVAVALAVVLGQIKIFRLPYGGSVTAGSMVPLLWFALRHGLRSGIEVGAVYGMVDLALGGVIVNPIQILLDYPVAFACLGLAGAFRRKAPLLGVIVGMTGRFLSHFVSGVVYFADYAPEGMSPIIYSAIYNGTYILPELIISLVIISILLKTRLLETLPQY
ncbi:energy-coupled thiamine transporter ThiT [Candidatus Bathyarchaeota archaeon]|nr:MAG: energy-coupled thiamine transporter ThiT [Candidatus Bathyarchaeota archaeon]